MANDDLLLVTVLKGAVMFVTDLARTIPLPTQLEFMAVSSYGSSTSSSGVVRILKDLDRDINDRDVLIVEDIIDSGLTLSWLLRNLATRHPRSLKVCTLLRKPEAVHDRTGRRLCRLRHPQRVRRRLRPGLTPSATATCPTSARSNRRCTKSPERRTIAGMADTRTALRICPFCEATCGLTLTISDDRVTAARGDRDDVFSAGFICPKGASFGELDNDPDRLTRPLIRRDGVLTEGTWDEAYRRRSPNGSAPSSARTAALRSGCIWATRTPTPSQAACTRR